MVTKPLPAHFAGASAPPTVPLLVDGLSKSVITTKDLPSAEVSAWLDHHGLPKGLCGGLIKEADCLEELLGLELEDIKIIIEKLGLNVAKRRKFIRAWEKQKKEGKDKEIASLEAKIRNLRMQLKASGTGGEGGGTAKPARIYAGPNESYMLQNPTHLTNLDYLRRILDEIGRALLYHYTEWVEGGGDQVVVSGQQRSPAFADTYAVLKHAQKNHNWYAKKLKFPPQNEFLDRVNDLVKLRNNLLGHQLLKNPRKCTQEELASAMVSAYKIAPMIHDADWVLDNLRELKKRYESQFNVENLFDLARY